MLKICRNLIQSNKIILRNCTTTVLTDVNQSNEKLTGYAEAFKKFDSIHDVPKDPPQTFANLLKNSPLIDLGDPEGKIVTGKIIHVVDDDLYIDFGWKFHCVCPRPQRNSNSYIRGAKVRLKIKSLELSSKFLGYEKELTLLEADCTLLGLIQQQRNKT